MWGWGSRKIRNVAPKNGPVFASMNTKKSFMDYVKGDASGGQK